MKISMLQYLCNYIFNILHHIFPYVIEVINKFGYFYIIP